MRRIAFALALLVAGCARVPEQAPQPSLPPPTPTAPAPQPRETGAIIGMTAAELVSHFGSPALQVREGRSLKLQFRGTACVLDAYLYPSASGGQQVTHVDARLHSGADTDVQACIGQLARGS